MFSDRLPATTTTEYTEATRCVLKANNQIGLDDKTARPIKWDGEKWQWYDPQPSDLMCFEVNVARTNYRAYGEAGKVTAWIDDGDDKGHITEYKDCIVADAKNWTCTDGFVRMSEGVLNKARRSDWFSWQLNWLLDFARQYDHRWYRQPL